MSKGLEKLIEELVAEVTGLREDTPEIFISATLDSPWSWLPGIDVDDDVVEIEDGRGVQMHVHGDPFNILRLEDFSIVGVTVSNDLRSVLGEALDLTNLRFSGQVDFADLQGDGLFAAFSEPVEVNYDGTHGVFELSGGDDEFIATYDSGDVTVNGHSGKDEIITGSGNDDVRGGSGNDFVYAGAGDDMIRGGDDHDHLYGAGGDDTVLGGNGNDVIIGGNGDDILNGQAGNDRVYAGAGEDVLMGSGNDTIDAGAGADEIVFMLEKDGFGQVNTGWDDDSDLVLINNVGVDANIAMHLGAGDQAVGYTDDGIEIDLDAFYVAADGQDFMVGATTFTEDFGLLG